jgi:hypothetical protein
VLVQSQSDGRERSGRRRQLLDQPHNTIRLRLERLEQRKLDHHYRREVGRRVGDISLLGGREYFIVSPDRDDFDRRADVHGQPGRADDELQL